MSVRILYFTAIDMSAPLEEKGLPDAYPEGLADLM